MTDPRKAKLLSLVVHPGYEVLMELFRATEEAMTERAFNSEDEAEMERFFKEARGARKLIFGVTAAVDAIASSAEEKSEEGNNG